MNSWIERIFDAEAADKGAVVRRSIDDVEKLGSLAELLAECRKRDYHLIETGDQFVVICNSGVIKIHC